MTGAQERLALTAISLALAAAAGDMVERSADERDASLIVKALGLVGFSIVRKPESVLVEAREEQNAAQEELRQARADGDFDPYRVRRRYWSWAIDYLDRPTDLAFWRRSNALRVANELQLAARGKRPPA
jgi:hypothetical protein